MNDIKSAQPSDSQLVTREPGVGDGHWLLGDLIVNKLTGRQTGGKLAVLHCTIQPGSGSPPHIHGREDETFYILSGTFDLRAGDRTIRAEAGAFLHIPKGTVHNYVNVGSTPGEFIVMLSPAGFEEMFAELGIPATDHTTPPAFDMGKTIERLIAAAPKYHMTLVK